jgi:hypothetical protein
LRGAVGTVAAGDGEVFDGFGGEEVGDHIGEDF